MEHLSPPSNLQMLLASSQRILLLQGPLGHFFQHFADWLSRHGKTVYKLNFNYGDEQFYPEQRAHTYAYQGTYSDFDNHLDAFVRQHRIDAVVCFGDTRPYHLSAKALAQSSGLFSFWAFEEGYFRPFYVTLEKDGVNAYSSLPTEAAFFQTAYPQLAQQQYREPLTVPGGFWPAAQLAARYYVAANFGSKKYPHYVHHRHFDVAHYIRQWTLSAFKRINYWLNDRHFAHQVASGKFGRFYILPLQVFNDSQVRVHSDFSSVRSFLHHVLDSFAHHAPADTTLIVKHHPMDRGFIDYQQDINLFISKYPQLKKRLFYIHDVPLPVLLRHGVGMITLNSTSGLSALIHNMPVKVLGRASYDIAGITAQQSLADFWIHPERPDAALFHAYRMYHINVTQINGSFYSRVNLPDIRPADG